jgi:hypothetical protein
LSWQKVKGLESGKRMGCPEIHKQIEFLKRLANSRPEKRERLPNICKGLEGSTQDSKNWESTMEERRGTIMGFCT